jgi:hypothetical protein
VRWGCRRKPSVGSAVSPGLSGVRRADELYEKLKPFKELVAEDIKDADE